MARFVKMRQAGQTKGKIVFINPDQVSAITPAYESCWIYTGASQSFYIDYSIEEAIEMLENAEKEEQL